MLKAGVVKPPRVVESGPPRGQVVGGRGSSAWGDRSPSSDVEGDCACACPVPRYEDSISSGIQAALENLDKENRLKLEGKLEELFCVLV